MFFVGGDGDVQSESVIVQLNDLRYTTHDPIIIEDNSDFTAGNGISGGDGTETNPYLISGYEIDAKGGDYGISVYNTSSHFIIESCYIYNTTPFGWYAAAGINFYNMSNGSVVNTVVADSEYGILAQESSNIVVRNSSVSNNSRYGIYLGNVNESSVGNSSLWGNEQGIYLVDSHNNTFYENRMINNSFMLVGDRDTFTTQTMYPNNTVNGKPVYYYSNANMNNASVPSDAGELLIGNVSYLNAENMVIENVDIAMEIAYSRYISVQNTTVSHNIYGIWCFKTDNATFSNNTVENQTRDGLVMDTLNYTDVLNNKFRGNEEYGISIYSSFNSSIEENIFADNGGMGMFGDAGVNIYYSQYNYLENNWILNNTDGVMLYEAHNNLIANNTILNNSGYGLSMSSSSRNYIENNSVGYNTKYGMYLWDSSYNGIIGNTMEGNGITLDGNIDTFTTQTIENNTANGKPIYYYKSVNGSNSVVPGDAGEVILGNASYLYMKNLNIEEVDVGIEIGYSEHIYVENNTLRNNNGVGLWAYNSQNISVKNNTVDGNMFGMQMEYSDYNVIADNLVERSESVGMYLYRSNHNTINDNAIERNGLDGILLSYSDYNTITYNQISNNTGYGIYITAYTNNLIYANSFYFNNGSSDKYNASHIQAYDRGPNTWNTEDGGNYWYDWANNNASNDQNGDGIVDWSYKLDGGAEDQYPLKSGDVPVPEFSMPVILAIVLLLVFVVRKRF